MTQFARDSGVWKPVAMGYAKDAGVWKPIKQALVKDAGVWKPYGYKTLLELKLQAANVGNGSAVGLGGVVTSHPDRWALVFVGGTGSISATVNGVSVPMIGNWGRLAIPSTTSISMTGTASGGGGSTPTSAALWTVIDNALTPGVQGGGSGSRPPYGFVLGVMLVPGGGSASAGATGGPFVDKTPVLSAPFNNAAFQAWHSGIEVDGVGDSFSYGAPAGSIQTSSWL